MDRQAAREKIAISGWGCCCAAGTDVESAWNALEEGRVLCRSVPEYLFATEQPFPVFAVDRDVPALCGDGPESGEGINRTIGLALSAARQALQCAGLDPDSGNGRNIGIILGTTVGCTFEDEEYYVRWRQGEEPDIQPVFNYLDSNPAIRLRELLGLAGPAMVITNACASGTDAVGLAARWLQCGLCDAVLAGGSDALSRIAYHGFSSLMLTSRHPCRPFDRHRDGLNLGEGAGLLLLEKDRDLRKRGQKPLGWIHGYGAAADAHHPTAPHPQGRGLAQAITTALGQAQLTMREIDFINCHGTGTPANDRAETAALEHLAVDPASCAIVSTKGVTGHTLGAAGAIETIFTLRALQEGKTRGTIGYRTVDPALPFSPCLEDEERQLEGGFGLNLSLAFGGGNAALVLEGNRSL